MLKMGGIMARLRTLGCLFSAVNGVEVVAPSMLEITLYTKENCSLCLKAGRVLHEFQRRHTFRVIEVDITTDEDLYERYRHDIPVATWNGEEIFRHRVEPDKFEAFLNERIERL